MEIQNLDNNRVTITFSKNELSMLRSATGGATFKGTTNRDIPVLETWEKEEALKFEKHIRELSDAADTHGIITLSEKELQYLLKIHTDNMEELDPIEYPTITGIDFEEAVMLRDALQAITDSLNR